MAALLAQANADLLGTTHKDMGWKRHKWVEADGNLSLMLDVLEGDVVMSTGYYFAQR